ncbi:hypothetical protein [Novosphingobium terrae]|uniref:hypothetical protein n=1 Tax=Novosphingobium terrae TaxID=2726189 RepID=UPI00197F700F|nr:hypothetical protein [Novosphingobium terrae]
MLSLLALAVLTGCAGDQGASPAFSGPAQIKPLGPPQLGQGRHLYQFELRDWHGKPQPDQPFALSIQNVKGRNLPFVADRKKVYQGVTDAQGRTPVIALPFRIKPGDWRLRERFGSGPYGEDFRLTGPSGKHPLPGLDYTLVACGKVPRHYEGTSNAQGFTAYIASEEPEHLTLYYRGMGDDDPETLMKEACPASSETSAKP